MTACVRCKSNLGELPHPHLFHASLQYCSACWTLITFDQTNEAWDDHVGKVVTNVCVDCYKPNKKSARPALVCDNDRCSSSECWLCVKHTRPVLYQSLCQDLTGTRYQCLKCEHQGKRLRSHETEEHNSPMVKRKKGSVTCSSLSTLPYPQVWPIKDPAEQKIQPKRIALDDTCQAFVGASRVLRSRHRSPFSSFQPIDFAQVYQGVYHIQGVDEELPIERVETFMCRVDGKEKPILVNTDETIPDEYELQAKIWFTQNGVLKSRMVEYDRYLRPQTARDQFDDHDPKLDKIARNADWRDLLLQHHQPGIKMILLDSPKAMTTNTVSAIERHGKRLFDASDLFVPNLNAHFLEHTLPSFQERATFCHASVGEFIRDIPAEIFPRGAHFAGDYCCTVEGNEEVRPLADLTLLFKRQLFPKKNGCLWLTFALRGQGLENSKQRLMEFLTPTAQHYGYQLRWMNPQFYSYGRMSYFYFVSY